MANGVAFSDRSPVSAGFCAEVRAPPARLPGFFVCTLGIGPYQGRLTAEYLEGWAS